MECIRQAAVSGFNETLNGIKKAQEKFADTQEHFVSLLTFCDCEKNYVFDKVPVAEARPLTMEDYQPCCCTPLYDAMGFTLTTMRNHVRNIEDAVVVVTIITDGLENASKEYTGSAEPSAICQPYLRSFSLFGLMARILTDATPIYFAILLSPLDTVLL